jgi:hypothetical protein
MHEERVNHRVRLLHHRLVARRLAADPGLIDDARRILQEWQRTRPQALWMEEWGALLSLPIPSLRRELTRRTERADRLRISSPFAVTPGVGIAAEDLRRRLWRMAKRGTPGHSPI